MFCHVSAEKKEDEEEKKCYKSGRARAEGRVRNSTYPVLSGQHSCVNKY